MSLELILDTDDLNFKVQKFIGSGISQFSKHIHKDFVFYPNRNSPQYDLEQIKKIILDRKMNSLKILDLSLINNNICNDYSFLFPLENLISLDLSDTGIDSLEYLRRMTKLKYLYLNNCENLFLIESNQMKYLQNLIFLEFYLNNFLQLIL